MSARDLESWLQALGLARYARAFADHGIDLDGLPGLGDDDLKRIGVRSLGHRKKLLSAISELSDGVPITTRGATSSSQRALDARGERRTVTVLFCDIANFTGLSQQRDAEEVHALLNEYFEIVDNIVQAFGGHVDKHIGDAVMAVFGAPVAHTNDPERAVRAAFAIQRALARQVHPLEVHMGLASGTVVASRTGSRAHVEYTVTGHTVNLAASLQDLARSGQILVSESVHDRVARWVEATLLDSVQVKGMDRPVRVWRLDRLRTEAAKGPRATFVGRRAELDRFAELLARCLREGRGQLIYVRGEAGIGKSRLVDELRTLAEARGVDCHTGLVFDFGDSHTAIVDVACSLLGLGRNSSRQAREHAVERAVRQGLVQAHRDVYLYDVLDVPQPAAKRARYRAMPHSVRSRGKRETLAELVAARSRTRPQLVAVEDVHWADAEVLGHLAHLCSHIADVPVLLVITTRIPGDPWAAIAPDPEDEGAIFDLAPLSAGEAAALAGQAVAASRQLVHEYVARSGGNPLFLEQLLRNTEERGGAVPGSIHSIVQARLDNLDVADKHALQTASVLGQRFVLPALRYLLDDGAYRCDRLVAHHLLVQVGDCEYMFTHALVMESVYASLLKTRQQELHRRAAAYFVNRDPALHAEHLERAGDPDAAGAYVRAATALAAEYRFERALELCERGIEQLRARAARPRAEDRDTEYALTCLQGDILRKLGAMDRSMAVFRQAEELAATDEQRCHVWLRLAEGMRITERTDEALEILGHAKRLAAAHGLVDKLAALHFLHGNLLFPRGDIDGCLEQHMLARDYAKQAGSAELEARALSGLGDATYMRGLMRTAHRHFDRLIALCREHDFVGIEAANLPVRGMTWYLHNELAKGLRDAEQAASLAAVIGDQRAEIVARIGVAAHILIDMDRRDEARATLARGLELSRALGARRFEPVALAYQARLAAREGERDRALDMLRRALAMSREASFSFFGPSILGVLAVETADAGERRAALAEAEDSLRAGTPAYNHMFFYRDAMEACLLAGEPDRVERYAAALAEYTRAEPLPWAELFIARGRVLAAHLRGSRTRALSDELGRLHVEVQGLGHTVAAGALSRALRSITADH